MTGLRWTILIIGALSLLIIYVHGRLRIRSGANADTDSHPTVDHDALVERREPALDAARLDMDEVADTVPVLGPAASSIVDPDNESAVEPRIEEPVFDEPDVEQPNMKQPAPTIPPVEEPAQEIEEPSDGPEPDNPTPVVFYVVAPRGEEFLGTEVLQALSAQGLVLGEDRTFHRYVSPDRTQGSLFRVANAMEPGAFPENVEDLVTPGLAFFAVLPAIKPTYVVVRELFTAAEAVSRGLHGRLLGDDREPVTPEKVQQLIQRHSLLDTKTPDSPT
ncbi:MAG: cell division protein ZipA C-terminal FtsZ-binding domain-containing protein [Pseudomonadota bacterium]|nr:cell division protein ZipA C-terminal FtsZ-binding domain-containing protein [Pseudomonadota bacterium]